LNLGADRIGVVGLDGADAAEVDRDIAAFDRIETPCPKLVRTPHPADKSRPGKSQ
jgi:hypothetical protein